MIVNGRVPDFSFRRGSSKTSLNHDLAVKIMAQMKIGSTGICKQMGNEYNHLPTQKVLFVPMLCSRPSVMDVIKQRKSVLRLESFAGEPLSPRVTCTGQLKKRSDSSGHFHRATINNNVNYLKLKKLPSDKELVTAASISVGAQARKNRVRNGGGRPEKGFRNEKQGRLRAVDVYVDIDPPLPVIKKAQKMGEGAESLWKRRSGGVALPSLDLQH